MIIILIQIVLVILLVLLNGYFAMSEIALITVKKNRLKQMKEKGNKKAEETLELLKDSKQFLSTIQIGITFAGFLASASTAAVLATPIAGIIERIPFTLAIYYSEGIAVIITTALISYLSLVFGELVPKQLALQWKEKLALKVTKPIKLLGKISSPLVKLLSYSTKVVLKVIPGTKNEREQDDARITEEYIRQLLHQTQKIEEEEKDMIEGVFTFGDTEVIEIMTPRIDIAYLHKDDTIKILLEKAADTGYSRFPVIGESLDDMKGLIHIKDVVDYIIGDNREVKIKNFLKKIHIVSESKRAVNLLAEFQMLNMHMAVIIDEYGGTAGIITLEDLIEEIVGDIQDEHDKESGRINRIDKNHITVRGCTDIGHVNHQLNVNIPDNDKYETIAGYILYRLHHMPRPGEHIKIDNWSIIVTDIKDYRIRGVKFVKKED